MVDRGADGEDRGVGVDPGAEDGDEGSRRTTGGANQQAVQTRTGSLFGSFKAKRLAKEMNEKPKRARRCRYDSGQAIWHVTPAPTRQNANSVHAYMSDLTGRTDGSLDVRSLMRK